MGGQRKGSIRLAGSNLGNKSRYLDDLRTVDVPQLGEAVVDAFGMSSPLEQVQHVPWGGRGGGHHDAFKRSGRAGPRTLFPAPVSTGSPKRVFVSRNFTVLGELGGAEEAGDPEGLSGPLQGLVLGRQVVLGEGQLQVAGAVRQAGVLLTLAEGKHTFRQAEPGRYSGPSQRGHGGQLRSLALRGGRTIRTGSILGPRCGDRTFSPRRVPTRRLLGTFPLFPSWEGGACNYCRSHNQMFLAANRLTAFPLPGNR